MDTTTIKVKYNNHTILYEDLKQAIEKAKIRIHFPASNKVLSDLSQRITYTFEGVLLAAQSDNLYSAFILYRSLLEHFFKGMYIITKTAITKSDETAEKYQKHYLISEFLAQKAGTLEMEDLLNEKQNKTDFISFITTKIPELNDFDKVNQQEISAAIRQFNLKEIIKYLYTQYNTIDELKPTNHIIAETLLEYSHISTFSHGGPYASLLMENFKKQNNIQKELLKIVQIGLTSTCVIKENLFITYEIDKSFKQYQLELQSLRSF